MICINFKNGGMIHDSTRMIVSNICMISSLKYPKSLIAHKTQSHVYQQFFGNIILNQHQNHCVSLIKQTELKIFIGIDENDLMSKTTQKLSGIACDFKNMITS